MAYPDGFVIDGTTANRQKSIHRRAAFRAPFHRLGPHRRAAAGGGPLWTGTTSRISVSARATPWPGRGVGTRLAAPFGYRDPAYARPSLILMGNEQAGLTDALAAACDVNVKIPMRGRADSLNLAIATGVMVYAVTD